MAAAVARELVPELSFAVRGGEALRYSAAPAIGLQVGVERLRGGRVRSIMLHTQVRIAARGRTYSPGEQERLADLFGAPTDWRRNLHSLLWANVTCLVPPFDERTVVEVELPCSYDLEVGGAGYLQALGDGAVPLELLFSGTLFYADEAGLLRVALIPSSAEASWQLPVEVWRAVMERHFPGAAWLRLRRETFDRLAAYRARNALRSWEEALERLIGEQEAAP